MPMMLDQVRTAIPLPAEAIERFCEKWKIVRLELFGSVLREDFDAARSDVDFLVTFAPAARMGLFEMVELEDELEGVLGRSVDVLTRRSIERSRNPERRQGILGSSRTIYAVPDYAVA